MGAWARRVALVMRRARWLGRGWPLALAFESRVRITGSGHVRLANRVRLNREVWLNAEEGGEIAIGERSAIGRYSQITASGTITIGADVLISPGVIIMDHSHGSADVRAPYISQPLITRGAICIEDGCWLGAYVCVLSGTEPVTIGEGSVIGAGAIVTKDVPAWSVVVSERALRVTQRAPIPEPS